MDPAEAVRGFLETLGVPPQRIPQLPEAQYALYRSLLAGRRLLIVLDNARDSAHVRPLLPASSGCFMIVTSRDQLVGLVASGGAHPIYLDLLTADEARELLSARLGSSRILAEQQAIEEIIACCSGLPLALTIVAARAHTQPSLPLEAFAAGLSNADDRLDLLTTDDSATNVRNVFSWSYGALDTGAARLFRLLGLHPGPDISAHAAASLTGLPVKRVRPLLSELASAHLLAEHTAGRYALHDLLRTYATSLARLDDFRGESDSGIHRMLDHYLHTAYAAARQLQPHRDPITLNAAQPRVTPEQCADAAASLAWFTTEHAVLLAIVRQAAASWETHTWQIAWTLTDYLDRQGHWHDGAAIQSLAVLAADQLADRPVQALTHRLLARNYLRLGNLSDAESHSQNALAHSDSSDKTGQAHIYLDLAQVAAQRGNHSEAVAYSQEALGHYQRAQHQRGHARALNAIGWYEAMLGNYQQALAACESALRMLQQLQDLTGLENTWDSLGYIYHHLDRYDDAVHCYQEAVALSRQLGDRYPEAFTLTHLGDTHDAAGHKAAAQKAWQQAKDILEDLGHPEAADVRRKLASSARHKTA
jgi:tetratricopeptide (TPR) repeat protein